MARFTVVLLFVLALLAPQSSQAQTPTPDLMQRLGAYAVRFETIRTHASYAVEGKLESIDGSNHVDSRKTMKAHVDADGRKVKFSILQYVEDGQDNVSPPRSAPPSPPPQPARTLPPALRGAPPEELTVVHAGSSARPQPAAPAESPAAAEPEATPPNEITVIDAKPGDVSNLATRFVKFLSRARPSSRRGRHGRHRHHRPRQRQRHRHPRRPGLARARDADVDAARHRDPGHAASTGRSSTASGSGRRS